MPSYISRIAALIITAMLVSFPICAQQTVPDWDFSYTSVLEKNKVAHDALIRTWLARYKSPAEKWFSGWQGKPIVSSILIEYPAFHAAEHTTMWLVRTEDEAFYWVSVEGREKDQNEEPIAPQIYDAIYKQASSWQQMTPKPAKDLIEDEWPGYFGFLSHHGPTGSKQILLTLQDFVVCLDKSCLPGKLKSGRFMAAIEPILIPESEKNYKHKSEAEIARMTPAQRIDEQILEDDVHRLDVEDKQSKLIRKYRHKDGLAGFSYLVQLIDSYNPRGSSNSRYSEAVMMALQIDNQSIRLRASVEGRKVIEAIERLSAKMKAHRSTYSYDELDLPKLKGLNFVDHSIWDTLWVKYRIKMSDAELIEFANYLIRQDPTYPSWSEADLIKDHSRINEAGFPAQVYVMRDAARFHQAYLAFKKPPGTPQK